MKLTPEEIKERFPDLCEQCLQKIIDCHCESENLKCDCGCQKIQEFIDGQVSMDRDVVEIINKNFKKLT